MAEPSPARLYATLVGALLLAAGVLGFFYSSSFGAPGEVGEALGAFAVNGWVNVLHFLCGALGLLVAGYAARRYALWIGVAYLVIGIWGFAIGDGKAILGFLPVNTADDLLHVGLGLLGVAAALGTPVRRDTSSASGRRDTSSASRPEQRDTSSASRPERRDTSSASRPGVSRGRRSRAGRPGSQGINS